MDLKASLFEPRALTAASPKPERCVKRPIREKGLPSFKSRLIALNLKERRVSRCGTRRMRWEVPFLVATVGVAAVGGGLGGLMNIPRLRAAAAVADVVIG